ncbi:VLRF1 family aeRF1-type release factor [Glycomyces sp. L485]|uniref:VLRF1 family aeRF1-type release factor n=1 Tax=Glycomyces sp. L485 TaxID=2909235 RepID=UPI001F4A2A6D|nr:VLRF1 family aeRF1-type release factor [Glycomyces sp. L485]MCH7230209.1 VLRF1 family aeRF1-type release factor [Glycomyces sp. L485]
MPLKEEEAAMPMDRETQLRLVNLRDDTGVLSLYVNADPKQVGSQPPWKNRLEKGVKLLLESVDGSTRSALDRRLHDLELEIEQLVRPGSPGIGRALFVPLSNGETFHVEMQTPLTDRVAFAPRSHIAPMFAAWAEGSPCGIAVVDGRGMRILDSRFGQCEEISGLAFELATEEWREFAGPATQRSAWGKKEGQSSSSQRDLFDFRIAEHLARFLAAAHTTLEAHVAAFGWEFLVLTGEPELVESASKALSNSLKTEVVASQLVLSHATPAQIEHALAPEMIQARRHRDERLAADFAEAPPKAALGSTAVLEALQGGRVDRLLLKNDSVWSGHRIPAGSVLADGIVPGDPDLATAVAEARLGEQMIELALGTDASVSILSDDAQMSEKAEGIGAFLRW